MHARRLSALLALVAAVGVPRSVAAESWILQRVVVAGQPAPGGGVFERFSIEVLPVVAPVNSHGHVAFFATILRGRTSEGYFRATGRRIDTIAAQGDAAPGGGTFSGFGRHPIPALNEAGDVAFAAAVSGGKTVEGIFATTGRRLRAVAVVGSAAPSIASGTFANLDAPALNDRGDVAFLATVRRGRESVEAIYLSSGATLSKVVAQGDPAPAGGAFAGFGVPALNAAARWRSPPSSRDARCPAACSSRALAGSGCSSAPATRRRSGGSSRNSPSASPSTARARWRSRPRSKRRQ